MAPSFLLQGICSELALVDMVADKLKGEAMDLLHAQAFMKRCAVKYDTGIYMKAENNSKLAN